MSTRRLEFILHWWRFTVEKRQTAGFTLIELLVSTLISGIIISGLMSIVVPLMQINQRESVQAETQRELQKTLDFMNSELREAIYVYGGDCLQGQTTPTFCPGITDYIPVPANSVPVLSFWKLEPLPTPLQDQCNKGTADSTVPCNSGRTYSLVVYFLIKNQPTDPTNGQGKARIARYVLTQYDSNGIATPNYVNPTQSGVSFGIWPYQSNGGILKPLLQPHQLAGNAVTLVNFVDDTARTVDNNVTCPTTTSSTMQYVLTPSSTTLSRSSYPNGTFNGVRSFYTCVRGTGFNQDVFVFLRGNAYGKAGISDDSFLPTLQTQVFKSGNY